MTRKKLQSAWRAHQTGDLDEAARLYWEIADTDPRNFDALYLLGFLYFQQGKWPDAEQTIGRALTVNPASLDGWYNRGRALLALGRHEDALAAFDRALAITPDVPEVLVNRGNALQALRRSAEAIAVYDRALMIRPDLTEAWNNRGNALSELKRLEEACASYDRALAGKPGDSGILQNRALALFELKRYENAARDFEDLLQADPDFAYARGNLLYCRLNICDWVNLDELRAEVTSRLERGERVVTPIHHAAFSSSLENQSRAARIWAKDKYKPVAPPLWRGESYRHDRIRLAYLSADLHAHATAALLAGVFETHDRTRFETVALSFGPDDGSAMRRRLVPAFERFINVGGRSDPEIASLIRDMEIDIAVDLKGYTQDSRPGILAHRPAPVQVAYLGFPGTMGTDTIDYIIADRIVIPPEHGSLYSEKIARLPDTYQGNDAKRRIVESVLSRRAAGLPENSFVFCCFNNNFKILPEIFAIWMRLLAGMPGSVLWLLEDNLTAARNLRREAAVRGIAPERLVFAPRIDLDAHLARHRLADLFLDTLPYNAHTTASDALWAGLPLVTCAGNGFAGRVAASLLNAAGLAELVTNSLPAYEALARHLAGDASALDAVKSKLAASRLSRPLFDTARFTANLERAYVAMWERRQRGLPPECFDIPSSP